MRSQGISVLRHQRSRTGVEGTHRSAGNASSRSTLIFEGEHKTDQSATHKSSALASSGYDMYLIALRISAATKKTFPSFPCEREQGHHATTSTDATSRFGKPWMQLPRGVASVVRGSPHTKKDTRFKDVEPPRASSQPSMQGTLEVHRPVLKGYPRPYEPRHLYQMPRTLRALDPSSMHGVGAPWIYEAAVWKNTRIMKRAHRTAQ